ncbi:MAG: IS5 family transposase [Acidimicrobiales bacterium]
MLDRHDLTDEEWGRLEPLLPDRAPVRGGRWADHRVVINGVFWRTRTGSPWRDLPAGYGNWKTVYNRHRRWSADGTWVRVLDELRRGCDRRGDGQWAVGVDSTVVRAHQHAAGARRRPPVEFAARVADPPGPDKGGWTEDNNPGADREGLGRSRGGLTTKIHLAADPRCRPISRVTTPGQRNDAVVFDRVMAGIRIGRLGPGRPRTRPDRVLSDKAYSSRAIRSHLRKRGIKATIAEPADQQGHRARRGRAGGRPPQFDTEHYKRRNTVERCINKLKTFRAVATRYDKREYIYQGTIDIASIRIWLRDPAR